MNAVFMARCVPALGHTVFPVSSGALLNASLIERAGSASEIGMASGFCSKRDGTCFPWQS